MGRFYTDDEVRNIEQELNEDAPALQTGDECECGRGVVTSPMGCEECEAEVERAYWAAVDEACGSCGMVGKEHDADAHRAFDGQAFGFVF